MINRSIFSKRRNLYSLIRKNNDYFIITVILLFIRNIKPKEFYKFDQIDNAKNFISLLNDFLSKIEKENKEINDISIITNDLNPKKLSIIIINNIYTIVKEIEVENRISFLNDLLERYFSTYYYRKLYPVFHKLIKENASIFNPFTISPFIFPKKFSKISANTYKKEYSFILKVYFFLNEYENYKINLCDNECDFENKKFDYIISDLNSIKTIKKKSYLKFTENIIMKSFENCKEQALFIVSTHDLRKMKSINSLIKNGNIDSVYFIDDISDDINEYAIISMNKHSSEKDSIYFSILKHDSYRDYSLKNILYKRENSENSKFVPIEQIVENKYDLNIRLYIRKEYSIDDFYKKPNETWNENIRKLEELNKQIDNLSDKFID